MKVTMLGAGSAFTGPLMRDIMMIPGLGGGEIAIVDIDEKRLNITYRLMTALAERVNTENNAKWIITANTDRKKVLKGTDYVINSIEVSGLKCVTLDNDIPLKYGIDQCIGDTIGPGGIFKALRTLPSWIEILRDIEKLCPNSLVCNYTNPMSIMTLAAVRTTSAQLVGLCHSVQYTTQKLAEVAKIPLEEIAFKCAGINHLAWFTELSHKGKDIYPKLFKRAKNEFEIYESDPIRFEMMFQFGAFITESSGHFSEYLPYFRKRKDLIKKYCREAHRGESGFYSRNWPAARKKRDKARNELARDITKLPLKRGFEYASEIIEAHLMNRPKVIYGSTLNEGLITNLPADGVVEVATMVDNTGFNPCKFGPLPPQMAALCRAHMPVYDLAVQGILEEDREAIVHALMLDPLTAAVCSPQEIRRMTYEMALAEKRYIPNFMTKGLRKSMIAANETKKAVKKRKIKVSSESSDFF